MGLGSQQQKPFVITGLIGVRARKAALEYMKENLSFHGKDITNVAGEYGVAVIERIFIFLDFKPYEVYAGQGRTR